MLTSAAIRGEKIIKACTNNGISLDVANLIDVNKCKTNTKLHICIGNSTVTFFRAIEVAIFLWSCLR